MERKSEKERLRKQMELLAEQSKNEVDDSELKDLSTAKSMEKDVEKTLQSIDSALKRIEEMLKTQDIVSPLQRIKGSFEAGLRR